MTYESVGESISRIEKRINLANFLTVIQLFLKDNFLINRPLKFDDIKPRLLGHWGTCYGINLCYAVLRESFSKDENFSFVLGPGHGFPALNANLFIEGKLIDKNGEKIDRIERFAKEFSWPEGFPSHASPMTPGVITEGGELGYALAAAYGQVLGHPEKTVAVLLGDGEMETGTALASLNLNKLIQPGDANGKVIPILHLNGYKISGPTVLGRKSEREINEMIRGFGFTPLSIYDDGDDEELVSDFLSKVEESKKISRPFVILKTKKGKTGPEYVGNLKVEGNYAAHQIPLPLAKTDEAQLRQLEDWLKKYKEGFYDN